MATTTTSLKLDTETRERILRVAAAQRRTPHWVMREAIGEYIDRQERRDQLRQDALAAWADYQQSGLHLSGEEADEWLSKLEEGEKAAPPECHT